ncbi:hypothetical protein EDB89DRAFT_1914102 [Lactarius sanguifluus]|nr:hypothetical protein EDB89DRAFT_1914102 [Lactarius sanguifluus]
MTINDLPDNVFVEIFSICRMGEVDIWNRLCQPEDDCPWKWHRLAHVCRTWRYIMLASSHRLRLEHLCTRTTPIKILSHLPAFPISISFDSPFRDGDIDNLLTALEHRDRVRTVEVEIPCSLLERLATAMQEPFPALTYLCIRPGLFVTNFMPLPDTFLGGSAPCLQTIHITGIPFPAAPALLLSARDLIILHLRDIPPTGYIPPEAMGSSLAGMPRLKDLRIEFRLGMSYPGRMYPPPTTRSVLPALVSFVFQGLFGYCEDLVAQIDTPRLHTLHIEYLDQGEASGFQIPQLCKFVDCSENLKLSRFRRMDVLISTRGDVIELQWGHEQSSFCLTVHWNGDAIRQLVRQISTIMLSNVDHLFINADYIYPGDDETGSSIQWLEIFRPLTTVKVLSVDRELSVTEVNAPSQRIPLALNNITGERAAEVLPALELLFLGSQPVTSVEKFVATRQSVGRPVTVINEEMVFRERLDMLDMVLYQPNTYISVGDDDTLRNLFVLVHSCTKFASFELHHGYRLVTAERPARRPWSNSSQQAFMPVSVRSGTGVAALEYGGLIIWNVIVMSTFSPEITKPPLLVLWVLCTTTGPSISMAVFRPYEEVPECSMSAKAIPSPPLNRCYPSHSGRIIGVPANETKRNAAFHTYMTLHWYNGCLCPGLGPGPSVPKTALNHCVRDVGMAGVSEQWPGSRAPVIFEHWHRCRRDQYTSPGISRSHLLICIWVSIGRTTCDDPGCSENVTSSGFLSHFRHQSYQDNAFPQNFGGQAPQARKVVVTLLGCLKAVQHTSHSGPVHLSSTILSALLLVRLKLRLTVYLQRIANAISLLNDYLPPNGRSLLEFRFSASASLVGLNDIVPGSNHVTLIDYGTETAVVV